MAKKPGPPPPDEVAAIEIDTSIDETMEIVKVPVRTRGSGVRAGPAAAAAQPSTSRVRTAPVGTAKVELDAAGDPDELSAEDVHTLEAVRQSVEKSAKVLRAIAQLCLDKQLFTPDEIRRKN
jgi:hypothetical protein